jgi:hypothetical protein
MATRKIHPNALRSALQNEAARLEDPRVTHKPVKGKADALEAEAGEQYAAELRDHIPGLAISPIPCRFVVPCKPSGSRTVSLARHWREPGKWQDARAVLMDSIHYWEPMEPLVPEGWSYAEIVDDAKPDRFDITNPRVYSLAGAQVPWEQGPGQVGAMLTAQFEPQLTDAYRKAPTNGKRTEVEALLEHHRTKGGNPSALADHVERMLEHWKESPPTYVDLHKFGRVAVPNAGQLTNILEAWLANARIASTSTKGTGKAVAIHTAPPLRTMAERLDAKRGAREAFDNMLLIDGSTNKDGQWILTGRKGRAEVVAAWDAVVEIFGVEGYAKEEKSDKALSAALREYIPGLTIGERPNKLRNTSKGSAYAKAWVSCERYLKERRERIIAERSDTSE